MMLQHELHPRVLSLYIMNAVRVFCNHCDGQFSSCETKTVFCYLNMINLERNHINFSLFCLFNLLYCFWQPGAFSEQDSFVFYQKLPLASGIKELSFH